MELREGLPAVLSLLLLLSAVWQTTGATAVWDDPFYTATIDDYVKEFDEGNTVITVYEDVPVGYQIGVLHIVAQPGDPVAISQDSTNELQLGFNGTTAEQNVYIQTVLDMESKDSLSTGIQLNGGSTSYLEVQVADINDNPPVFDGNQGSQISVNVQENQLNDSVLILTATDADDGATATLTYELDAADYGDLFRLNAITKDGKPACQLQLLKELDYEERPLYRLTVTVKDTADVRGTIQSSSVTVFVNVQDVGDSPPRWLQPPMAKYVDENIAQGTELLTVEAIDGDTSVNNDISYSITSQDPEGFVEMADPKTGKVTLTKGLDREDPDLSKGFISVVIQARETPADDPDQPCSDISCVNGTTLITVNDLDDNDPTFDKTEYSSNWTEGSAGTLEFTIDVTDKDMTPQNNQITAELKGSPQGVFELTATSGVGQLSAAVRVMDRAYLDYEIEGRRVTTFTVEASGNDKSKVATATVTVTLQDKNDNDPKFTESSYSVDVLETAPGGFVLPVPVLATDDDASPEFGNDSIKYSFSGVGQWADSITIDEDTGEITLAKDSAFDSESGAQSIQYTLRATDNGGSDMGNQGTADLIINVIDVDDTPPKLSLPQSEVDVVEEDPDALVEADITASDADGTYELSFSIDWDHTEARKDGAVVDPKDYDYASLFDIAATDSDNTKAQLVVVDPGPDREKVDTIRLRIRVNDTKTEDGEGTDEGDLTVNILDINDNDPYFVDVDQTTFNVTENMPKTSTINRAILAKDVDEDNIISYSLTGEDADLVAIDGNGQLSVKGSIDREEKDTLTVTVTINDSGTPPRSSSATISIEVLDQNDNGPEWDEVPSSLKNLTVQENEESAHVYTLQASDIDAPDTDFSKITYSLREDGMRNFSVDPASGELTVKGKLDREVLSGQNYIMTIQVFAGDACDADSNCAHNKEGLLSVTVLDVNDCPPVFPEQEGFLVKELETIKNETQLKTIRATDDDEENTAASKLTYALRSVAVTRTGCEGKTELFAVENDEANNQAILKAKQDLQGCWGDYNITLEATDGEDPHNHGTAIYMVRIEDVNDAPTVVSPANGFAFELPEDTYPGHNIPVPLPNDTALRVRASDQDDPQTDNAVLTYSILDSSTPDDAKNIFYVDTSNGTLVLSKQLDRESSNGYTYNLQVQVKDRGEQPLSDTVSIIITVSDVDEFAPKFVNRFDNKTSFTEENEAGKDVKDISSLATDDDETDIIFYFLVGGAKDVFELVDPTSKTPQLRNKQKLDREVTPSYQLILQTTRENKQPPDVGVFDPDDLSQLSVVVVVDDINDMTPNFGNRRFMGGIAAGDPQGMILRLASDDPDVGDITTYSITSDFDTSDSSIANISDPFVLDDKDTSSLKLNFDVNEGMDGYFDFTVTAKDAAQHTNSTTVRIFIIVEDDRVKFVFANQYTLVQAQQDSVADALTDAFSVDGNKYVANVETVLACPDNPQCTNMITHFIDDVKVEPVLGDVIINLQFRDGVTDGLIAALGQLQLNLTAIGDTSVKPTENNDTIFQMLLIVVASVMGGILALTCITSCIHTHKLRRQVKALSINAFGSRESGLQNAGLMVPGSNMFANQGANPIFTMDEKKAIDAESVSSGDSVLIGIENDPEFANSSRPGLKRPAPSAPPQTNPAYQPDPDDPDDLAGGGGGFEDLDTHSTPAVFDEHSHHHMPSFDPDDDEDIEGPSPFGGGGGMTQNPLFGAGGGSTQNPLFGAEMTADGDLSSPAGQF